MDQLINELIEKAGLDQAQAEKAVAVVKDFIVAQVPPAFSEMVENFFKGGAGTNNLMDQFGI